MHAALSRLFPFLGCMALAMALHGPARAAVHAEVTDVLPPALVQHAEGSEQPLAPGMALSAGDVLRTGPGGHASLTLDDGSSLELFEDTVLELNLVLGDEDEGVSFTQYLGHMAARVRELRSPDFVVTPTMVIGIRGTEFTVSVAEDGASAVSVAQGEVLASTETLQGAPSEAAIPAGQEALLESPGQIIRPRQREILSPEDWREQRQERLEALLPRLPELLAQAPERAAELFERMRDVAGELPGHVAAMQELEAELLALGQGRPARRAALKAGLLREAVQVMAKARRIRAFGGALRSMFVRQERLAQVLPEYEQRLGEEYATVMAALDECAALRLELEPQVLALVREVRATLQPVRSRLGRVAQALGVEPGQDGARERQQR